MNTTLPAWSRHQHAGFGMQLQALTERHSHCESIVTSENVNLCTCGSDVDSMHQVYGLCSLRLLAMLISNSYANCNIRLADMLVRPSAEATKSLLRMQGTRTLHTPYWPSRPAHRSCLSAKGTPSGLGLKDWSGQCKFDAHFCTSVHGGKYLITSGFSSCCSCNDPAIMHMCGISKQQKVH